MTRQQRLLLALLFAARVVMVLACARGRPAPNRPAEAGTGRTADNYLRRAPKQGNLLVRRRSFRCV